MGKKCKEKKNGMRILVRPVDERRPVEVREGEMGVFMPSGHLIGIEESVIRVIPPLPPVRAAELVEFAGGNRSTRTLASPFDRSLCVVAVAFSPNGESVAQSSGKIIRLWDLKKKAVKATFCEHIDRVTCLAFDPSGVEVASGSDDCTVVVRRVEGDVGTKKVVLKGHQHAIAAVCYSPDGKRIASASRDGTARIWEGNECIRTIKEYGPIRCCSFTPDGSFLACGGKCGKVMLYSTSTWKREHVLEGHVDTIVGMTMSPNGELLGTLSDDGTVRMWDMDQLPRSAVCCEGIERPTGVYMTPNGRRFGLLFDDKFIVQGIETGTVEATLSEESLMSDMAAAMSSAAFSPDGKLLCWGLADDKCSIQTITGCCVEEGRTVPAPRKNKAGYKYAIEGDDLLVIRNLDDDFRTLVNLNNRESVVTNARGNLNVKMGSGFDVSEESRHKDEKRGSSGGGVAEDPALKVEHLISGYAVVEGAEGGAGKKRWLCLTTAGLAVYRNDNPSKEPEMVWGSDTPAVVGMEITGRFSVSLSAEGRAKASFIFHSGGEVAHWMQELKAGPTFRLCGLSCCC